MKLTAEQVKMIEKQASPYMCGAWDCCACYPLEYVCDYCEEDLPSPILNGQRAYCDACGGHTNEERQAAEHQKAFWLEVEQMLSGEQYRKGNKKAT